MQIVQNLLTPNKYSRPKTPLGKPTAIVIHWVANPGSSALANRNFFESRKEGKLNYGSAHFIVGLKGEIIQCIPENELAYHVGATSYKKEAVLLCGTYPNKTTIGIEMTHMDWTGKPSTDTLKNTIDLCIYLFKKYKLDPSKALLRHFDVTGKDCHKWYINNETEWNNFKELIIKGVKVNG